MCIGRLIIFIYIINNNSKMFNDREELKKWITDYMNYTLAKD